MSSRTPGRIGVIRPDQTPWPPTIPTFEGYTVPGLKSIKGPVDPLEGPGGPDTEAGLVQDDSILEALFKRILIATRAAHPMMSCAIEGQQSLPANSGDFIKFAIGKKTVPALALVIQNNSGAVISVGLDDPPSPVNFQLPSTAGQNLLVVQYAALQFASIWVTQQTYVVGVHNKQQNQATTNANSVFINAWSNPEWDKVWGEI